MSDRPCILVVDDEPDIVDIIVYNLRQAGMEALAASDASAALRLMERRLPDLIVLDLMLPDMEGTEFCRRLKYEPRHRNIPIIILTARGGEVDRIVGLELGADDYVTKPFSPRELILRVRAILKRTIRPAETEREEVLSVDQLELDPASHEVRLQGQRVDLTTIEFKLLLRLLRQRGRVLTREALLREVWGYSYSENTRTVDTHIQRLRAKLLQAGNHIETVRGVGYRFRAQVQDEA